MKKYSTLRSFLKRFKNLQEDYVLKDCPLVIDGDSVFRRSYEESGCKFILGGEFDRYAHFLKKILTPFIESNVTCYVVFKGARKLDIERRKKNHQALIDEKISIVPGDGKYYEPVFVKDVYKQVLEELGIKYSVCEYDAYKTLLDVSRAFNCPVLSNNIEISLMFMSCITPASLVYDQEKKQISCLIQTSDAYYRQFRIYHKKKPVFMAILDEAGPLFRKIPQIIGKIPKRGEPVGYLMSWVMRHQPEEATLILGNLLATEAERETFQELIDDLSLIFLSHRDNFVVRYFLSQKNYGYIIDDNFLFRNGLMTGRVAIPYINLKNGTFSGSWVICDENKRDAMEPALDIVMCAYGFVTKFQKKFNFLKRYADKTDLEVIERTDNFYDFIEDALRDFDWLKLNEVPKDSWLLIITLVYCMLRIEDFITAAYSILLSYVMLGPVSEKVGLIKRSKLRLLCSGLERRENEIINECTYEDCLTASTALVDYFYEGRLKKNFDRSTLHDLAEFQHCLQQMNYLNKLFQETMWGEDGEEVKCTNYSKTYNGTFVFNVLRQMRKHETPMAFIKSHLKASPSVLKLYVKLKDAFESCVFNLYGEQKCKEQFHLSLKNCCEA